MTQESVWQTWKPYVAIIAAVVVGFWWFNNQSSVATLKDGPYACQAVFVNADDKYEALADSSGAPMYASATVRRGELTGLTADTAMSASDLDKLTMRTKGTSHFHVTDDPAMHSYNAIACDYAG